MCRNSVASRAHEDAITAEVSVVVEDLGSSPEGGDDDVMAVLGQSEHRWKILGRRKARGMTIPDVGNGLVQCGGKTVLWTVCTISEERNLGSQCSTNNSATDLSDEVAGGG